MRSLGKSNASATTVETRHKIAARMLCLKKNVITVIPRQIKPKIRDVFPYLYSVSLLSKMMSLIDVLSALRIDLSGMRHSMITAPRITPIKSATESFGMSNATESPLESVPMNITFMRGSLTRQ